MGPTYKNQFGGHGFPNGQRQSFDLNAANFLESLVQREIGQSQALSPVVPESYGSNFSNSGSGSGSPTPPATTHHQQTTPQPYAVPPHHGNYFTPDNPISIPHSTSSSFTDQYRQTVSEAPDASFPFALDMDFGGTPVPNLNGGMRLRNNQAE